MFIVVPISEWEQKLKEIGMDTSGLRFTKCTAHRGVVDFRLCHKPAIAVLYPDGDEESEHLRMICGHTQVCLEHHNAMVERAARWSRRNEIEAEWNEIPYMPFS